MFRKFALPVILVVLFSGKVLALETSPIEIIEYIDDAKIVAFIDKHDLNSGQHWNPLKNTPPLSIDAALKAVQKHIKQDTDFSSVAVRSIELKPISHHEDFWHYIVKLKYKRGEDMKPHFFVVLMSGKVISAIRHPDAIK